VASLIYAGGDVGVGVGVGVDLGDELSICATVVSTPLKETEG
jgi:hypothetical protein